MPKYAAFLRGINLGRRRVTNDRLANAFAGPGVSNVTTFLASGNVMFDAGPDGVDGLKPAVEQRLSSDLGFEVETFIRPLERLAELVELPPPPKATGDGFNVHAIFLGGAPDKAIERALRKLETEDDVFEVRGSEVLWHRRGRMSDSAIRIADLERALGGMGNTMRNMKTVRRIVAKFGAEA